MHLAGVEVLERFDQDALTAGEAVEAAKFERVARSRVVEAGEPLGAVGLASIDEHTFAASGAQLGLLRLRVLLSLRDAYPTSCALPKTLLPRFRRALVSAGGFSGLIFGVPRLIVDVAWPAVNDRFCERANVTWWTTYGAEG